MFEEGRDNLKREAAGTSGELTDIEPHHRHQRSHWLLPSDRYAYAHARATTKYPIARANLLFQCYQTNKKE